MIPPIGMAIAAMTVMLWIIWSDIIRTRRPAPILYAVRIALFLIVSGIMVLNLFRYPHYFSGGARIFAVLTVMVALAGVIHFGRKLVLRR
jgi:hypothetical protein